MYLIFRYLMITIIELRSVSDRDWRSQVAQGKVPRALVTVLSSRERHAVQCLCSREMVMGGRDPAGEEHC